jgi:hypothetical protein
MGQVISNLRSRACSTNKLPSHDSVPSTEVLESSPEPAGLAMGGGGGGGREGGGGGGG